MSRIAVLRARSLPIAHQDSRYLGPFDVTPPAVQGDQWRRRSGRRRPGGTGGPRM